jgi:hypothetical protein
VVKIECCVDGHLGRELYRRSDVRCCTLLVARRVAVAMVNKPGILETVKRLGEIETRDYPTRLPRCDPTLPRKWGAAVQGC